MLAMVLASGHNSPACFLSLALTKTHVLISLSCLSISWFYGMHVGHGVGFSILDLNFAWCLSLALTQQTHMF